MDDTGKPWKTRSPHAPWAHIRLLGFFSVQVLERALQVWGLTYAANPRFLGHVAEAHSLLQLDS